MNPHDSTPPEPTAEEIEYQAYLIWIGSGRAPHRDVTNWLEARELLRRRLAEAQDARQAAAVTCLAPLES